MEEEPSSQQHESSEVSDLDGELQSDLGEENQEQGEEDQGEGQEDDEAASGLRSGNGSGQDEEEQLESVWQGGEDIPQQQPPARSEKKSTPKKQKPSLERALEPVQQRGQPRGQFYEMLYEIEHLIKIVQEQGGEKVVIVKWRNFALSECTRQPLSYIKQIDLMKDQVEKLEEEFQQTKFAPESIVRVKTKIRQYLDGYRKMVFPVSDPSGQTEIQVGGMGPLNANNQQRQISFQQLTRCQAAAFHSTRKKFQILLSDATEQDYYHLRSVFHDSYLRVKNNRKLYREFGLQKRKSMLPIYQSRQIPRFKNNLDKIKVPKLKMSREIANHKVQEVIAVQRDGDVFNYCIQENKRIYIVTLSQMRKYFPRTLPRFLRELLDLMEEVMHLQIDPDEHFINYRMTRFRESNRAKQIIELTDKEGQPIYFGADDEDVEENKRIDIEMELQQAEIEQQQEEAQYRGQSMMDIEEDEGQHHQESEMKDQAEQARQLFKDQQKDWRKQVEMEMEMVNLNQKPSANGNPPLAGPKNGTQMEIENEGNAQNPNETQKEDEMIDLNAEQDEYSDEDSQQSQSSAGTFDEDYEEMRQALQYYGVQIDLDQPFDEQQDAQPQEQEVAIDFNLMELQNLRYYDDNDLIETGFQPRLSKKEMKKLDKADKQVLGIKDKKGTDNSQQGNEDGQQQNQNSSDREQMQQEEPEEFDSEVQPESDSQESSDGFGLLKRDKKEEKMLKKGILPDQSMEDQSLSGFSYSESSLSSSLGPNAMDQEPSSRQYIPRHPTHYGQIQTISNRSFKRTKQKVNPSFNPPQVIQISSDSSPLGRSNKRQKRY